MSDRRDGGVAQAPAKDPGAISLFDATAQQYLAAYDANSLSGYVLRTRRARVLDLLGGLTGRVLDVGCGPGVMPREILDAGGEFWGVDGPLAANDRRGPAVQRLRPSALRSRRRRGAPVRG
jgi:SAM-dependent methyltransferase